MKDTELLQLAEKHGTDKASHYLLEYSRLLGPRKHEPFSLLELGVQSGLSLRMWQEWMPEANIIGLDLEPPSLSLPRVHLIVGSQSDEAVLQEAIRNHGPFRAVIDDCSHVASEAVVSFLTLFPALEPGGFYFIEDWGTGYWPGWADGARLEAKGEEIFKHHDRLYPSHLAGMVGFTKQLLDACVLNVMDIKSIHLVKNLAIVEKAPFVKAPLRTNPAAVFTRAASARYCKNQPEVA